jgi:PAS domain S-box-containing protein
MPDSKTREWLVPALAAPILDSAMDAIITVDDQQRVVLFNAAAEQVFGVPQAEAIGSQLDRFIPQRFRGAHAAHMRQFGETGASSRRMGHQRIVAGLRASGEEFPIDASISQIVERGRRYFTVILRDVTQRVRAENELRESREEIKQLALAANRVREAEKSRIARELHDELGQALTALKIDVVWMKQNLSAPTAELASKLTEMQVLVDGTVAATRRISSDLRPLILDDLGLAAAVEWLVQNFSSRTGVACELAMAPDLEIGEPHATGVFRVLQESLTNIAKHAQATQVEVNLDRDEGHVVLHVQDNGRGFDASGPRKEGSFGLLGIRERATLLGGEFSIDSEPGRGTRLELRL